MSKNRITGWVYGNVIFRRLLIKPVIFLTLTLDSLYLLAACSVEWALNYSLYLSEKTPPLPSTWRFSSELNSLWALDLIEGDFKILKNLFYIALHVKVTKIKKLIL